MDNHFSLTYLKGTYRKYALLISMPSLTFNVQEKTCLLNNIPTLNDT